MNLIIFIWTEVLCLLIILVWCEHRVNKIAEKTSEQIDVRNEIEFAKLKEMQMHNKWRQTQIPKAPINNVARVVAQAKDHAARLNN